MKESRFTMKLGEMSTKMTIDEAFKQFVRIKRNNNLSEASIESYSDAKKYFNITYYISLRQVKNRRQHIIPISSRLEKILIDYLAYRKGEPDDYLFCDRFGEQLERWGMASAIRRYNHSRGVEKTSMHLLNSLLLGCFCWAIWNYRQLITQRF